MEKNEIILLKDRGLISISGEDAKDFLQNIITNDVSKVSNTNTIFSGLFTPQGKYLFEFFLIQSKNGYLLDCDNKFTSGLIDFLIKYKLRSKVEVKDFSNIYTVGILGLEKFNEIKKNENKDANTIEFEENILFIDPRRKELGVRMISSLEKLYFLIKRVNLRIIEPEVYYIKAHSLGIPIKGIENLREQLFGLEANFDKLQGIDFRKGCYIGQENTARMNLKNKVNRQLKAIKSKFRIKIGDEIKYKDLIIGKVLIDEPLPFALIKLHNPEILSFKDKEIKINNNNIEIIS